MIRILIVDDSITQREILHKVLEADGEFTVVGEARDGVYAVEMVKQLRPDVVLMDVHMPQMDGIEATRQIMKECPVPVVIISASLRKRDLDHGMAALEAGAVAIVQKPQGAALLHLKKIGPDLHEAVLAASRAKVQRPTPASAVASPGPKTVAPNQQPAAVEVVGICASTGGPPVLVEILSTLPSRYPLPILLVQHIAGAFVEGFATWLERRCGQTVKVAGDGQRLEPCVWLAPPGMHLSLGGARRLQLIPKTQRDIHCPSGNPLFSALARHCGSKAVGVQLTGMGDDGAQGLLELKNAGGLTLVQNEATCVIYGMPRAAKLLGAATHELTPDRIAAMLCQLAAK
jgi:two-component system chemotaxis response regulator CheB